MDASKLSINKLNLGSHKLIAAVDSGKATGVVSYINPIDLVIPLNGTVSTTSGYPKYSGESSKIIQVLGSQTGGSWSIKPNEGKIQRGGYDWWNAGHNRTRLAYTGAPQVRVIRVGSSTAWGTSSQTGIYTGEYLSLPAADNAIYGMMFKLTNSNSYNNSHVFFTSLDIGERSPTFFYSSYTNKQMIYSNGEPTDNWSVSISQSYYLYRTNATTVQIRYDLSASFTPASDYVIRTWGHQAGYPAAPASLTPPYSDAQISLFRIH